LHATEFLQVLGRADELGEAMVVVLEVEGTIDVTMNVYDDVLFDDSTSQFHLGKRSQYRSRFPLIRTDNHFGR
jgi:hypothetical protein